MFRTHVCRLLRPNQVTTRGHQLGVYRLASSDASSELVLERLTGDDEGIAIIGFNRPKAMNSLSKNLLGLFKDAIDDVKVSLTFNRPRFDLPFFSSIKISVALSFVQCLAVHFVLVPI